MQSDLKGTHFEPFMPGRTEINKMQPGPFTFVRLVAEDHSGAVHMLWAAEITKEDQSYTGKVVRQAKVNYELPDELSPGTEVKFGKDNIIGIMYYNHD